MKYKLVVTLKLPTQQPHQLELSGDYSPHGEEVEAQFPIIDLWLCHHLQTNIEFVGLLEVESAVHVGPQLVTLPDGGQVTIVYSPAE